MSGRSDRRGIAGTRWYRKKTRAGVLVFFFAFGARVSGLLSAETGELVSRPPRIARLDGRDVLFKQYLDDVEAGRRAVFSSYPEKTQEELGASLVMYSYTPRESDDILLIAARCNIAYDAFATLNRWQSFPTLTPDKPILLPSMPGIFVPDEPESDLERLVASRLGEEGGVRITIRPPSGPAGRFRFFPGESFSPNERLFFAHPGFFRFPLHQYRLTSPFGMRVSPISGRPRMHGGLDLAAPSGTPVFAAREGTVTTAGSDPVYGKYVIVTHNNGWTSLYGHLSSISVTLNSKVKQGTIIGKVGSTGLSTGPHLHFELRENGRPQDPRRILKQRGGE